MAAVTNTLPVTRELVRSAEFAESLRAAAYQLTLGMGVQDGAAAAARYDLVMRLVVEPDPVLLQSMTWTIASMPQVIEAYQAYDRAINEIPDAVFLGAVEGAWRLFAALTAAVAGATVTPADLESSGNPPLSDLPDEPAPADPAPEPEPEPATPEPQPTDPEPEPEGPGEPGA